MFLDSRTPKERKEDAEITSVTVSNDRIGVNPVNNMGWEETIIDGKKGITSFEGSPLSLALKDNFPAQKQLDEIISRLKEIAIGETIGEIVRGAGKEAGYVGIGGMFASEPMNVLNIKTGKWSNPDPELVGKRIVEKIIQETREETLKECLPERKIILRNTESPEQENYEDGFNACRTKIIQNAKDKYV